MSTTIDSRVVEMQFDNRHFESNVSTTMSTLDKLKAKLNLDGASKGLENVSSAAGKVDMSPLATGVENVRMKFSAMEVVAVTTLANITNSAVNTGKQLLKSLTVDQLTSGWTKYGQKTGSVQTILNATGKSLPEVNEYLEKLMWFSDETSYGFTDMTAAMQQMTSAGGDMAKLTPLIMGVANATAFAGKGATEFSRVMYNLNQSYSKGYLDYTDWKSIDLAGVGSKQLKQTIIDTALAMGKIKKNQVDLGNFATTLKDKWADTAVMEAAFGKFAEKSEEAYEIVSAGGMALSDDLKAIAKDLGISQQEISDGWIDIDTASRAYQILEALDKQKQGYASVAITAAKAAQEAKTFEEAIDATKEAVASGWMQTFEIIFGDYEEAKELWTELANTLWDVFASGAEVRNWVVKTALHFAEPWRAISEKLGGVTKAIDKVKGATKTLEEFQNVVNKVWRGDFNNRGDNPDRKDLLEAAGWNYDVVQDLVNKGYQYKLTMEDVEASHKKFGVTMADTTEETIDMTEALNNLTDDQLRNAGLTEDEIELYRALAKEAKRTGKSIDQIAKRMSENDGREMLIDSFRNIGGTILDTIQLIKDAAAEIFDFPTASDMVVKIHNIIMALHDFTERIRLTNKETGELTEAGEKFQRIFRGIFAAIDGVITILKAPVKIAFNVLKELLTYFGIDIQTLFSDVLGLVANVGDGFVVFRDVVDAVVDFITQHIVENVKKWIEKLDELGVIEKISGWFQAAGDKIASVFSNISDKITNFNLTPLGKGLHAVGGFITSVAKKIGQSEIFKMLVDGVIAGFEKLKDFFTNFKLPGFLDTGYKKLIDFFKMFKLPEFSIDGLKTFFTNADTISEAVSKNGVLGGMGSLFTSKVVDPTKKQFQTELTGFTDGLLKLWLDLGNVFDILATVATELRDKARAFFKKVSEFIFGTEEVNLSAILDIIEKFVMIKLALSAISALETVMSPLANISDALNNLASSVKWKAVSSALKSLAIVLGVFTVCLIIIYQMEDMGRAWSAFGMIAAMLALMTGIIVGLGLLSEKMGGLNVSSMAGFALSLLALAAAVVLMGYAIKQIDELKLKNPGKTFVILGLVILGLSAGIRIMGKAADTSAFKAAAAIVTLLGAMKLILEIIDAYDQYDWSGKEEAIMRMTAMLILLSASMSIIGAFNTSDNGMKGVATSLLAMVVALKLMIGMIDDIATKSDEDLKRGIAVIAALMGLMTVFIAVANLTNKSMTTLKKGEKAVNHFTGLAIALLTMVAAIWLLGRMDIDTLKQGGIVLTQILILFTGMLYVLGKSCSGLKTGPIIAMLIMITVILAELTIIIRYLDDVPWESKVSTVASLGVLLLALAGVMYMFGRMTDVKAKDLWKCVGVLTVLALIVAALAFVLKGMNGVSGSDAIGQAVALSALLFAMAGVLHILESLDMRKFSTSKLQKLAGIFAGLVVLVWALGVVISGMNGIDGLHAVGNAVALGILLGAMSGVLYILSNLKMKNLSYSNMAKIGVALLGLTIIMGALSLVLLSMSKLGVTNAVTNALVLSELLIVLAGVTGVLTLFKVNKNTYAAVGVIALLGVILAELAGVLALMNVMNVTNATANANSLINLLLALTVVTGVLTLFKVNKNTYAAVGAIALLGAVLAELAGVLALMNVMNVTNATANANSLINLLLALTVVTGVLTLFKVNKNTYAAVGVIALLGAVVLELGFFLSLMTGWNLGTMMPAVKVLSVMLGVLTIALAACIALGYAMTSGWKGAAMSIAGIALLGAVVLELGFFLSLMTGWNLGSMMPAVVVLSTMLGVLTVVLAACAGLGFILMASWAGAAMAIVGLALLGLVVWEIGGILNNLKAHGLNDAMPSVLALSAMMTLLTDILAKLSILGVLAPVAVAGTIALALLGLVVWEIGGIVNNLTKHGLGDSSATMTILNLIAMLQTMASTLGLLTVIGMLGPAAYVGIVALGIFKNFILAMGVVTAAIGWLMEKCPSLEKFVGSGIELFKKLARGMGEIISEFGAGLTTNLPEIGTNLSSFATEIGDFITTMSSIDADLGTRIETFVKAIGLLVGADILSKIGEFLNSDKDATSLEKFGTSLSNFGTNVKGFIEAMNIMKPETATAISQFCDAMAILTETSTSKAWSDFWLPGEDAMVGFGESMKGFAESMKSVAASLADLTEDDIKHIENAAAAAEAMAKLNSKLPREGGILQDIVGSQDLAAWGEKINTFADSLTTFSIKVSGGAIDKQAILDASEAAGSVSKLNAGIPKTGGIWQDIAGEADLVEWGRSIVAFASSLVAYSSKVSGQNIDKEAIIASCEAATEIAKLNDAIPESDGMWQWITGEKDLSAFGTGLTDLADGLLNYCTKAVQIQSIGIEPITHTGTLIDEIKKVCEKLPKIGFDWGNGIHDPGEFGTGINALADGLYNFCKKGVVLNALGQAAISGIQFTGTAIDELKLVVEKIPEIDNMKTTIPLSTAASNLKGFCETINAISTAGYDYSGIDTIGTTITKLVSLVTQEFKDAKSDLYDLKDVATAVKDAAETLTWLNDQSYGGVAVLNQALTDLSGAAVDDVVKTFQGKAGLIESAVTDIVFAISNTLENTGKTSVANAMIALVEEMVGVIGKSEITFTTQGVAIGYLLANGLASTYTDMYNAASSLVTQAAVGVSDNSGSMTTAGNDLGNGLINGINAKWDAVYWAGYSLGQAAVQGEKDGQASNSPSKLTIQAGKWLGEGLVIGMGKMNDRVYRAGSALGETATSTLSSTIAKISEAVNSDIDSQPTIRPVLDLSDVESGASAITSMFGSNSIGVKTNIGAISSMMNTRNQNGVNADVVSAIEKLNKKMDNIQNASYTINGITYDDGSNVTDAVATLVRAARIERRV